MNWSLSKQQLMNCVNFCGITYTSSSGHQIMLSGTGCVNTRCGGLPNCCWPYLLRMFTKLNLIPWKLLRKTQSVWQKRPPLPKDDWQNIPIFNNYAYPRY